MIVELKVDGLRKDGERLMANLQMADTPTFHYIRDMRQRLGLEPDETRGDDAIRSMTPMERFKLLCGWHFGDPSWASTVIAWAKDVGFKIDG